MSFNMLGGLLPIKPREAARDVLAGLTLASMNIPQVLGYTRIAGTPVITGLYTVLLPLIGLPFSAPRAISSWRRIRKPQRYSQVRSRTWRRSPAKNT